MLKHPSASIRIAAITITTRGVSFAILEGSSLLDWGTLSFGAPSQRSAINRMVERLDLYQPTNIVIENVWALKRRGKRSCSIASSLLRVIRTRNTPLVFLTPDDAKSTLDRLSPPVITKADMATRLLNYFPHLKNVAPQKRKTWMGEDHRMPIFAAIALALCALDRFT